jgi:putative addiction module component (TIGR02574 family)
MIREDTMPDLDELLKTALAMDVGDRAMLAEKLLASLDELDEEEAQRLWTSEAERRLDAYRSGRAAAVPATEVAAKAERLLR